MSVQRTGSLAARIIAALGMGISAALAVGEVTIEAPASVVVGGEIMVTWSGADNARDFITVVPTGTDEGVYLAGYGYARKSPLQLRAPGTPGDYELRYLSADKPHGTLARQPLDVFDGKATLKAPASVGAGSGFVAQWTGPDTAQDSLLLVPKGSPEGFNKGHVRAYTRKGSPAKLRAPDEAGDYELRYLSGMTPNRTFARADITVTAQSATLTAPKNVAAGAKFKVAWTGPNNTQDYVAMALPDSTLRKSLGYRYTNTGTPVTLTAPMEPGEYELRYQMGQSNTILAFARFTVTGVTASLDAPQSVDAGAEFQVSWEGPDNTQDYISIATQGGEKNKTHHYRYTNTGNPVTLRAPIEAGVYEVRYQSGQGGSILQSAMVTVGAVDASVSAPASIMAGSQFDVAWSGPSNKQDYIAIAAIDAGKGRSENYAYTSKGSPAKLTAPETAGNYEVRYQAGQGSKILATQAIVVAPVSGSIDAPATALARASVEVTWEGPPNQRDYVIILPVGAPANATGHYAYTRWGDTLKIRTPAEPGNYELRYYTGTKRNLLDKRAITILPRPEPGLLRVVDHGHAQSTLGDGAVVAVILDASGSMLQKLGDKRRINVAKQALTGLINDDLPADVDFLLRVFGHKEADSCRTDLEMPAAPLNRAAAAAKIAAVQAMNLARTPIADSLQRTAADLAGHQGPVVIILVTDGEETCDGDPGAVIEAMAASGMDVRVNIVGFAIGELMLQETFEQWAQLGNGKYFDAQDADQLAASLQAALDVPFSVLNENGDVVATGTVNGAEIAVDAGRYRVVTQTEPPRSVDDVIVTMEKRTLATLP